MVRTAVAAVPGLVGPVANPRRCVGGGRCRPPTHASWSRVPSSGALWSRGPWIASLGVVVLLATCGLAVLGFAVRGLALLHLAVPPGVTLLGVTLLGVAVFRPARYIGPMHPPQCPYSPAPDSTTRSCRCADTAIHAPPYPCSPTSALPARASRSGGSAPGSPPRPCPATPDPSAGHDSLPRPRPQGSPPAFRPTSRRPESSRPTSASRPASGRPVVSPTRGRPGRASPRRPCPRRYGSPSAPSSARAGRRYRAGARRRSVAGPSCPGSSGRARSAPPSSSFAIRVLRGTLLLRRPPLVALVARAARIGWAAGADLLARFAVLRLPPRHHLRPRRLGIGAARLGTSVVDHLHDVVSDRRRGRAVVRQRRPGRGRDAVLQARQFGALHVATADPQVALLLEGRDRGLLLRAAATSGRRVGQCGLDGAQVLLGVGELLLGPAQRPVVVELGLQGGAPPLQHRTAFLEGGDRRGDHGAPALGEPSPLVLGLRQGVELAVHRGQRDGGALRPRVRGGPVRRRRPLGRGLHRPRLGRCVGHRVPPGEDAGDTEQRQGVPAARHRATVAGSARHLQGRRDLGGETRPDRFGGRDRRGPRPAPRRSRWHRATRATRRRARPDRPVARPAPPPCEPAGPPRGAPQCNSGAPAVRPWS